MVRLQSDLARAGCEREKTGLRVAAVIPAFNAGDALAEVVGRAALVVGLENIIVVDDGSEDGSCDTERLKRATCLIHPENRGKGAALRTGFREAVDRGVDAVAMLDADGQHDPERIRDLVEAMETSGADIILGSRMGNVGKMPWLRRLTNRTTSFLVSRLAGQKIEDSQSGFRLIRSRVLESLDLQTTRYDTESEMLIQAGRLGFRIQAVPIPSVYGEEKSKISPIVDTFRFVRLVFRTFLNRGG